MTAAGAGCGMLAFGPLAARLGSRGMFALMQVLPETRGRELSD